MSQNRQDRIERREKMRLLNEQSYRMECDREFWSECVECLLDGSASSTEATKAIEAADLLVAARRERFPL